MSSLIETDDRLNDVEESRPEHTENVALKLENFRLARLLARAEERVKERAIDEAKARNEVKRQQARVENGMRWAEERRMEFLQVRAERDFLKAEVERLQSKQE